MPVTTGEPPKTPGPRLEEGSLLEGRYRVDRVVGAGGFGVVHAGWHLVLDCPVAIKVLALSDADVADRAGRFLEEARTLSRLRHPGIVRVLDAGVTEAGDRARLTAWLVMEWCGERTLAMDIRERRGERRPPQEVWQMMRPLVDAVAAAHAAGVSHRDIKPSNIMLVDEGAAGRVARLIDFGIAKRGSATPADGATTTDGPRAHTPAYAAPEQVAGTRTGPWTDVHALGLVITELLAGERAYGEAVNVATIVGQARPTPKTFGVDVGAWETVLARALALDRAARYADAGALRDALDDALEGREPRATAERIVSATPARVIGVTPKAANEARPTQTTTEPADETAPVSTVPEVPTPETTVPVPTAPAQDRSRFPAVPVIAGGCLAGIALAALGVLLVMARLLDIRPPQPASTASAAPPAITALPVTSAFVTPLATSAPPLPLAASAAAPRASAARPKAPATSAIATVTAAPTAPSSPAPRASPPDVGPTLY